MLIHMSHACDYDVEGTLIGYNALKYACGEDSLKNVSRMKFSTLTKKDIVDALYLAGFNCLEKVEIRCRHRR